MSHARVEIRCHHRGSLVDAAQTVAGGSGTETAEKSGDESHHKAAFENEILVFEILKSLFHVLVSICEARAAPDRSATGSSPHFGFRKFGLDFLPFRTWDLVESH